MSPAFFFEARIPPNLPSLKDFCLTRLQRSAIDVGENEEKILRQLSALVFLTVNLFLVFKHYQDENKSIDTCEII